MDEKTGVLLVNLGTPDSPKPSDVRSYLTEFLTDGRVIDIPWIWRQLLVRGMIIPKRYKQSAASYAKIWTQKGSPLFFYKNPSIQKALSHLMSQNLSHLIILPLFPQYASATTGSVHQKVMEVLKKYPVIPRVTLINNFFNHPLFIEAISQIGSTYEIEAYDHILFSYHGLPQRQIRKSDKNSWCMQKKECCQTIGVENTHCYSAQCFATTQAIASRLKISSEKYSICFQSRLGQEPWLHPYAADTIKDLAKKGKKKVLVFCPSFVCDCLETIYEIGVEYADEFKQAGGQKLDLVRGLNADSTWIEALKHFIS
jgi:ferrochelatase